MKLTKEQLQEMLKMQDKLDTYIRKKNDIANDIDLTQNIYIALKTELHEFINEIEFFKHWKKNKGKEHILEEGVDCLHFILSLMNLNEYDVQEDLEITDKQLEHMSNKSMNELYIMIDSLLVDTYMMCSFKEMLGSILVGLMIMLDRCGYTGDDMYNAYIEKNKVNVERQNNAY